MRKYEKENLRDWTFAWLALLLIIFQIIFGTSDYMALLVGDKPEIWFQRSGSIVVAISVFVELSKVKNKILPEQRTQKEPPDFQSFMNHLISYAMVLTALIGTIIWGYGDLIYLAIH